jgi:hypothetical protein
VVPNSAPEDAEGLPNAEPPVFERSDFSELLQVSGEPRQPALAQAIPANPAPALPPPGAWGTHAEPALELEQLEPLPISSSGTRTMPSSRVLVLTTTKATLIAVAGILAVAVAFGVGLLVGLTMR